MTKDEAREQLLLAGEMISHAANLLRPFLPLFE
jgi:hypothetical protein